MNILARKIEPTPPARTMVPMPRKDLHPAVQEHAANYSDMLHELDRITEDNQTLRNDIEVERRTNAELRRLLGAERSEKERYMRYAVAFRTHAANIVQSTKSIHELAMDCAEQTTPSEPEPQTALETIEDAIKQAAAQNAPGPSAEAA